MLKREQQREQARQAALKALRSAGRALTVAEWAQRAGVSVNALKPMLQGLQATSEIALSKERRRARQGVKPRACLVVEPAITVDSTGLCAMPAWLMPRPAHVTQGNHGNV